MITPRQLKALYEQGHNISAILRNEKEYQFNTEETIEASYDLQSGSYIAAMGDASVATYHAQYSSELAVTMRSLCEPESILEAGVGEGTTLTGVVNHLKLERLQSYGFDLSWSRVAYAKRWLASRGICNAKLCTGSLFHVPFCDDSIDIVYTSHSIEPNGGAEESILKELYRVARSFLILLEPAYELAGEAARQRMEYHGYCRNLQGISGSLGYEVIDHRLFPVSANPLNPTGITIIRKRPEKDAARQVFACPRFKTALQEMGGNLFSPEALSVYPVVAGVPCLRIENGIFASKYPEIVAAA